MNVSQAALHYKVNRKTILNICHNPDLALSWGCSLINGEWKIATPPTLENVYKVERVARMMEKSRIHIYRWCKSGVISAIRVGRNYRIPKSELLKLIDLRD